MTNPYVTALEQVKKHSGTSGQKALAKCILSLYNDKHAFSIGEVLGSMDQHYTAIALMLVREYAEKGETEELRTAGEWVYDNFPRLIELSTAMCEARAEVRRRWEDERRNRAEDDE